MDWQSIGLTLRLSATTATILLVLGVPLAFWLARTRNPLRPFIEAIVALPLVLPPTVLGFYVLLMLGPRSILGGFYETITGSLLPFSFPGLVVGSVLFSLPFAVQPFTAGFRSVPRELEEAAWCLGESRRRTFWRVTIPQARAGLWAGAVLAFAHTLGEFGVALMVGGNIAGVTRTVSISIYDSVQAMDYVTAGWTSALLLLGSFLILATLYFIQRKPISAWPGS
ncbi:MAG: molybdate ABC transporter permease subunit [Puniceicoccaceae bacterium]